MMIEFKKEEVLDLLKTLSKLEGYLWSIKESKSEVNELLHEWATVLTDKLKGDE